MQDRPHHVRLSKRKKWYQSRICCVPLENSGSIAIFRRPSRRFRQVHGLTHTSVRVHHKSEAVPAKQTGSTPPFSYYNEIGKARCTGADNDGDPFDLGQPLVSFIPPFDASPLTHGEHRQPVVQEDSKADPQPSPCVGNCTSLMALAGNGSPGLLETLPESPFASNVVVVRGTSQCLSEENNTNTRHMASLSPSLLERSLISRQVHGEHRNPSALRVDNPEVSMTAF